jgi:hypothetical protein
MGGRDALGAEVVLRLDQAAAEVLLPDAVDRHAGGQRVAGSTIQRARSRRLGWAAARGGRMAGVPGATRFAGAGEVALDEDQVGLSRAPAVPASRGSTSPRSRRFRRLNSPLVKAAVVGDRRGGPRRKTARRWAERLFFPRHVEGGAQAAGEFGAARCSGVSAAAIVLRWLAAWTRERPQRVARGRSRGVIGFERAVGSRNGRNRGCRWTGCGGRRGRRRPCC